MLAEASLSSTSSPPVGSLVRYLSLQQIVISEDEWSTANDAIWTLEMSRLVRLLPNLTTLRGSRLTSPTIRSLEELVSCPSRPLSNLVDLGISSQALSNFVSLLERVASTLRYLGLSIQRAETGAFLHDPSTYPLLTFPLLTKLHLFAAGYLHEPLLLPLLSTRWSLPNLRSLVASASPALLPFV